MVGGIVGAHIICEQGIELGEGMDGIQVKGIEPALLEGAEMTLHLDENGIPAL